MSRVEEFGSLGQGIKSNAFPLRSQDIRALILSKELFYQSTNVVRRKLQSRFDTVFEE